MGSLWQGILDIFHRALVLLHDAMDGLFGDAAWGWAIILLTLVVRVALLPLAVKQTRSMRAMQKLQPRVKKLQEKYKVDRDLLRKDPETYRQRKAKLNEELMALYKDEGVNPAAGCLPLLAQAPVFFALFSVLRDPTFTDLQSADFYFFTRYLPADSQASGLGGLVSQAGWPGWLLILLMAGTMFWSQRQMIARTQAEGVQAQQQKILMYVMPVFLAFISLNFPLGVLIYWVTTNLWQVAQQAIILREVAHETEGGGSSGGPARTRGGTPGGDGQAASKPVQEARPTRARPQNKAAGKPSRSRDHVPRRSQRSGGR